MVRDLEPIRARLVPVENGCLIWPGAKRSGYGIVIRGGKRYSVFRLLYEAERGPIPQGMHPDHLCRVRACCNPDHIEVVTPRENTLRGEGPSAVNARKTSCSKCGSGYTQGEKQRWCTPCNAAKMRRLRARKKEAV